MKTQNGFTLLENEKDVKNWLNKQKVRPRCGYTPAGYSAWILKNLCC